jgi:hypothetical protein
MLVLMLIALPLVTATLIGVVRRLRPGFAYPWLFALAGGLSAWIVAWLIRPVTPLNLPLANWQPRIFLPISPALLLDTKSWPFLIALTTLALAILTTDVARPAISRSPGYWFNLVVYQLMTAFSILAVLSGNLLTVLLTWTLLFGSEFFLRLLLNQESQGARGLIIVLALRLASLGCIVWAGMTAYATGASLSLTVVPPQISAILLLAVGINLGVIPVHPALDQADPKNAGMLTLFQLAPSAPALVLLARLGLAGAPASLAPLFLLLAGWALIYAGLAWAGAPSPQSGLAYWIAGLASLALASAALGHSAASLAWGGAALFAGGLFSLGTARQRGLIWLWLLGLLSISAFPFTPTWAGAGLYALPFQPLLLIILAGQGLFLLGTLRHILRLPSPLTGAERWVGALYLAGLLLILSSYFLVAWFTRPGTGVIGQNTVGWIETGISLVAIGLAVLAMPFYMRRRGRLPGRLAGLKKILEIAWLYRLAEAIFRSIERWIDRASAAIEGRAGILWTLLGLALLVSLLASLRLGG